MVFVNVTRYLARRSIFNSMDTLRTFDRVLLCTILYFPLIPLRIKNSIRLAKRDFKIRSEKKVLVLGEHSWMKFYLPGDLSNGIAASGVLGD